MKVGKKRGRCLKEKGGRVKGRREESAKRGGKKRDEVEVGI